MINKKQILIMIAAIIGILLFSVMNRNDNSISSTNEFGFNSVNPVEFNELISNNPDAFLLDVHIPEQQHIAGTDAFIPFNEITENADQLPENKDTQILVYCRSGSMSREAAYELSQMGYTNIVDLAGGINAYREANLINN